MNSDSRMAEELKRAADRFIDLIEEKAELERKLDSLADEKDDEIRSLKDKVEELEAQVNELEAKA